MKAQKIEIAVEATITDESAQRCLRLVMSKYIDRVALFNSLSDAKTVEEIFAAIQAAPAEDVEPVRRGRWEWNNEDEYFYSCSNCGHKAYGNTAEIISGFYNYCPNCGARMEG